MVENEVQFLREKLQEAQASIETLKVAQQGDIALLVQLVRDQMDAPWFGDSRQQDMWNAAWSDRAKAVLTRYPKQGG